MEKRFRCYTCARGSDTELEHITHRCRRWSAAIISFYRRWLWRLFRYNRSMRMLDRAVGHIKGGNLP